MSASQDRKKSQKIKYYLQKIFGEIIFTGTGYMCIMYLFGKKKDFLKKTFKITGKRTKVLIGLCGFRKYRNADMILVEVI